MPFAFIDGFDDYPADMNAQGIGINSTWFDASTWGGIVPGRFGNRALQKNYGRRAYRGIPTTTQIAVGFAIKADQMPITDPNGQAFLAIQSTIGNYQFFVGYDDLGRVKVGRENPMTNSIASAEKRLLPGTWHFVELELVLGNGTGRVALYIDGDEQFNLINVDTQASGDNEIGRIELRANGGSLNGSNNFDDCYCLYDTSTRIGECRAQLLTATDDVQAEWTRKGGTTNASQINEQQIDSDVTYNSSNEIGDRDIFEMQNLVGTPETIFAVQVTIAAKKDDAGTRTLKHFVKSGAAEVLGPDQYQTTDYTWQRLILAEKPGGGAWTAADVNAMQIGYDLTL